MTVHGVCNPLQTLGSVMDRGLSSVCLVVMLLILSFNQNGTENDLDLLKSFSCLPKVSEAPCTWGQPQTGPKGSRLRVGALTSVGRESASCWFQTAGNVSVNLVFSRGGKSRS